MSKTSKRKIRRQERFKQMEINSKIKKRLFGHLFAAPCCYCKYVFLITTLTIEHLVPRCLGGGNEDTNIALACQPCNNQKGREVILSKRLQNHEQYPSQHYRENRTLSL